MVEIYDLTFKGLPYVFVIFQTWLIVFCTPEYCDKYANQENIGVAPDEKSSDEELSEDDYESSNETIAGRADP